MHLGGVSLCRRLLAFVENIMATHVCFYVYEIYFDSVGVLVSVYFLFYLFIFLVWFGLFWFAWFWFLFFSFTPSLLRFVGLQFACHGFFRVHATRTFKIYCFFFRRRLFDIHVTYY